MALPEADMSSRKSQEGSIREAILPKQSKLIIVQDDPHLDLSTNYREVELPVSIKIEEEIDVSIVIPLLNEEESLETLYAQLKQLLDSWDISCEVILVDDGSTDGSCVILKRLQSLDDRLRVVCLRRNFGQTAAFSAGFDHAKGEVIVTMDGDLQNDPNDIPQLLEKMNEGYDVVSGWRVDRQDKLITRRLPSQTANFIISKVTGVELHDYGCSLKAYRREVVEHVQLYGELHRFVPALASWMGIRLRNLQNSLVLRRKLGRI
jgi:glycosyltransferase involved in cell wall biosynthesis